MTPPPEHDAAPPEDTVIPPVDAGVDATDGDAGRPRRCIAGWCAVPTGLDPAYTLTAIWGSGANDVWAVGSGGTVIHWDGSAWKAIPTDTTSTLLSIWGSGANDIWAASSTATILHSGGMPSASFTAVPEAAPWWSGGRIHALWGTSASDLRIAGSPAVVYDANETYVGTFNQWRKTTGEDGGVGWESIQVRPTFTVRGMWGAASDDVWLVGDNSAAIDWMAGVVFRSKGIAADGGEAPFVAVDTTTTARLDAIWGSSADDVWVVGASGTIRHHRPGATRFEAVDSPVQTDLHALWGTGPSDIWAVGERETILHFDGKKWSIVRTGPAFGKPTRLTGIWGSGPNDIWAVGGTEAFHFTGSSVAAGDGDNR